MTSSTIANLDSAIRWQFLPELAGWTLEKALEIQAIPAPTFDETRRANYVAEQFRQLGLQDVSIDTLHNVYGRIPGQRRDAVLIAAHTDTVFAQDVSLATRSDGDLLYGPGLGDNSLGVAGMLALARALIERGERYANDLWFVAPVQEEGLGDLGGMRAVFDRLGATTACVINVEGLALGHVYHAGIAVRRLHITARAPGGHSWLHFGRPSAIHGILRLGAQIAALPVPASPRTTYNIGMIDGGTTINAIAAEASLWLDLRSEDSAVLGALETQVRRIATRMAGDDLSFHIEVVGDRPAGQIATNHWLVELALAALAQVNIRGALEAGSTDGNIPLSRGCPAVTVGISHGGNAHRLDEYIEVSPISMGLRQLILLTITVAQSGLAVRS